MKVALPPLTRASDHLTHLAAPERHIYAAWHMRDGYTGW